MAKGISSVKGNKLPKVGEENFYEVATYYPGTAALKSYNDIKWKLFVQQSSGSWRELRGLQKTGKRVPYSFPQKWHGKKLLIEAYIHSPEMKSPPGIIVTPVGGEPKIESIGFFDSNWNALKETPKYGQTVQVRINTSNMFGETLKVSLWERDTYSDTGHDESENANVWDSEKLYKVTNTNGRVEFKMPLDIMWKLKADKGIWDVEGSEHEYYLLVKGKGAKTKYSPQQNVKDENAPVEAPVPARNPPSSTAPVPSPAPVPKQEPLPVKGVGPNPLPQNDGVSPAEVKEVKVEGLTDAYFAKKEYKKQSGKDAGTADYTVGSNGNKTKTDAEKEKIAKIILDRVNAKPLKDKKEYTTLAAIRAGLTKDLYNKNEKVTFKTFKLEAEFVRVSSAPLEAKLYLVARTYFLDGKNATIIVKEKDGLIKGSANAILPILEITEADMEQTSSSGEVKGTEKAEFTGIIKDGMVKIPVHLRPKSDEDLKIWKDKLSKGIKDGEYTYIFGGSTKIIDEKTKKNIAGIILKNAIGGNVKNKKISDGKTAHVEDIEKALAIKTYEEGAIIKFPTYKKQAELLYLNAKATGNKQHDKEFLKSEGAYFEIGSDCGCLIDEAYFFSKYEIEVPKIVSGKQVPMTESQKVSLRKMFRSIAEYYKNEKRCCEMKQIAYLLATAKHEIGENFNPVEEANWLSWPARKKYFEEMYDPVLGKNEKRKKMARDNENTQQGDGAKYFGRGFVQLTWKGNYRKMKEKFKVDFVNDREKTLEHEWAMKILLYGSEEGVFTRKKLSDYINSSQTDYFNARRVINGIDKAATIAGYAKKLEACLKIECNCDEVQIPSANSQWYDPIDKPEITLYNYYGNKNPTGSSFGKVRNQGTKNHQGLDIFAPEGTPVIACLAGEIVIATQSDSGWGGLIVIKVKKEDLDNARRNYSLQYSGEIEKGTNYSASDDRFLRYAHLSKISMGVGPVKAGAVIGESGKTGNAAKQHIRARHLHFGIANVQNPGTGTSQRENPAFYVRLVPANDDKQKNNKK